MVGRLGPGGDRPTSKTTRDILCQTLRVLIYTLILAVLANYIYAWASRTPDVPVPDANQYWGPYPMDPNPDTTIKPFNIEFADEVMCPKLSTVGWMLLNLSSFSLMKEKYLTLKHHSEFYHARQLVNDLRERLLHYRKPTQPLENVGFTYGFNANFLTQVVDYWHNKYNFKERERFLNQYKHFKTNIQGLDIHFVHIKPENTEDLDVVPLLLLHGWPGSFREFYEMIPKLIKPQDNRDFVFEVFVPSLPGFGYSQAALRPGLGTMEMAVIMSNLMTRLGHTQYYVQGGDLGHSVGAIMATLYPNNVLGFHTNFPALLFNPKAHLYILLGSLWPSLIESNSELQSRLYPGGEKLANNLLESGYMHIQATKPDTIGVALTDSPAGLAAYILEKFSTWTNPEFRKAYDGNLLEKFTLTHLLDNVMIYWATASITTSMRVYAESLNAGSNAMIFDQIPTSVPTWGIKFKHELVYNPDMILKLKYKNYLQSTVVDDGGHFAALENPDLMVDDVYKAVSLFRKFNAKITPCASAPKTVYDYTVRDINGNEVKLDKYRGYVLIIVNVASQCGLTDTNYSELNELHDKYHSKGLRILAFPCNQFNGQEPGTAKDIINFTKNKGILFDIFEKVNVNGDTADPLWKFLKKAKGGSMGDFIKWNFSKFVVDRNGVPFARLGPNVNPLDLEPYILELL